MKLVFIIGSGAVGKMTVGQELMKITDFRLFHNHMMIEYCQHARQLEEILLDKMSTRHKMNISS